MSAGAPLLQADSVSVRLGRATVVHDTTLTLRAGQMTALVGPNGAGKTTLMRALAGLLPAAGAISLNGRSLSGLRAPERARAISYLPQGHLFHWPMAVRDIVALGRQPHADPFAPLTDADREAVSRALAATSVAEFAARPVTSLSGGERARVALARALATEAPILFADEPTASLDPRHQLIVMALLQRVARGGGAVLAIVHDLTLAARFADRVLVMHRGRLAADGAPAEALDPARVAEIFGIETLVVDTDEGRIPLPRRPL